MGLGADPWAGSCNPFDNNKNEAQLEILEYFLNTTGAYEAGSPWDEIRESNMELFAM